VPWEPQRLEPRQRLQGEVIGLALLDLKGEPHVEIHLNNCVVRLASLNDNPLARPSGGGPQDAWRPATNRVTVVPLSKFLLDTDYVLPGVLNLEPPRQSVVPFLVPSVLGLCELFRWTS
jgi:hypothetical protein